MYQADKGVKIKKNIFSTLDKPMLCVYTLIINNALRGFYETGNIRQKRILFEAVGF